MTKDYSKIYSDTFYAVKTPWLKKILVIVGLAMIPVAIIIFIYSDDNVSINYTKVICAAVFTVLAIGIKGGIKKLFNRSKLTSKNKEN